MDATQAAASAAWSGLPKWLKGVLLLTLGLLMLVLRSWLVPGARATRFCDGFHQLTATIAAAAAG